MPVRVLAEVRIDISVHTSDQVDRYVTQNFDLVLTVCDSARERCPVFPGARRTLHRAFEGLDIPDLEEAELLPAFRRIRDEIGQYSRELLDPVYSNPP